MRKADRSKIQLYLEVKVPTRIRHVKELKSRLVRQRPVKKSRNHSLSEVLVGKYDYRLGKSSQIKREFKSYQRNNRNRLMNSQLLNTNLAKEFEADMQRLNILSKKPKALYNLFANDDSKSEIKSSIGGDEEITEESRKDITFDKKQLKNVKNMTHQKPAFFLYKEKNIRYDGYQPLSELVNPNLSFKGHSRLINEKESTDVPRGVKISKIRSSGNSNLRMGNSLASRIYQPLFPSQHKTSTLLPKIRDKILSELTEEYTLNEHTYKIEPNSLFSYKKYSKIREESNESTLSSLRPSTRIRSPKVVPLSFQESKVVESDSKLSQVFRMLKPK